MAEKLVARFWTWTYDGGISDISALLPEVAAARGTVLDGPQALANGGAALRECERLTGAAGKTPGEFPERNRPFAGFVRTSVELFAAFDKAGVRVSPDPLPCGLGAVAEHYPGRNWSRLVQGATGKLPSKKTADGLAARRVIIETLGVDFPSGIALRHDHLDACLGAVIAAASDGALPGASVQQVGHPLVRDARGVLREGCILLLTIDSALRERVWKAVAAYLVVSEKATAVAEPATRAVADADVSEAGSPATFFVRVGITSQMVSTNTDAIAVQGLTHLRANGEKRRRILLPEVGGHLWLGDHGMFWPKHQESDAVAAETYRRLKLSVSSDDYDDLEATID